ncbi:integrase_H2C2 domain-containing protein [Nephila pilipes]|uniref:Integrase_H2C2 domain-containing protein n=1 Tax=Nephila pilipes TaxID=299642 RepID=A0A8X6PJN0_NEPPI|nr:integrase_H2C2 domain-containing protein [Nephila pilipes]
MQLRSFQDEKFLAKMQVFKDEEGLLKIRTKLVDSDEKEDFKFPAPCCLGLEFKEKKLFILLPANDVVVKLIREEHKKAMHAVYWNIEEKRVRRKAVEKQSFETNDIFNYNTALDDFRDFVESVLKNSKDYGIHESVQRNGEKVRITAVGGNGFSIV